MTSFMEFMTMSLVEVCNFELLCYVVLGTNKRHNGMGRRCPITPNACGDHS